MTKYRDSFIHATSFIKKLLKIKMVTLLLGHPVWMGKIWKIVYECLMGTIFNFA